MIRLTKPQILYLLLIVTVITSLMDWKILIFWWIAWTIFAIVNNYFTDEED